MIKHRTKQGNNYEFDAGLGFHLPTNRFGMRNQTMTQTTGTSAVAASKPVTNSKPPVNHFNVPQNVANRLEKACKENNKKEYETLENKTLTVIYPFMVIYYSLNCVSFKNH
jgi:hypothetical protein